MKAERRAAAEDLAAARAEREAVGHSLAAKQRELVELEAKILADSETVRTALEGVRASLEARGQGLGEREEDVRRRNEQLALREQELSGPAKGAWPRRSASTSVKCPPTRRAWNASTRGLPSGRRRW